MNILSKLVSLARLLPTDMNVAKKRMLDIKEVLGRESEETKLMWRIYFRSVLGKATTEEHTWANNKLRDNLKTLGFTGLILLPGTVFILPIVVGLGHGIGINIIPDWAERLTNENKRTDGSGEKSTDK